MVPLQLRRVPKRKRPASRRLHHHPTGRVNGASEKRRDVRSRLRWITEEQREFASFRSGIEQLSISQRRELLRGVRREVSLQRFCESPIFATNAQEIDRHRTNQRD